MLILKELISLLPPSKICQIRLIGQDLDSDSKLGALYYAILENEVKSDLEAAEMLYKGNPSLSSYKKLKQRLRERLLNTLFFTDINIPKYTDYKTAVANCYHEYSLVKLLLTKHARHTAIWLAEQLLEQTKRFEISELNYLLTADLMNHYGLLELNRKKYQNLKELNADANKSLDAEQKAALAFSLISFINLDSSKVDKSDYDSFIILLDELDQLYLEVNTNRFLLLYANAKALYLNEQHDYTEIINLCKGILEIVKKKHFENRTFEYVLIRKIMNSYFNLGQIDKANMIAKDSLILTKPGTHNWFIVFYYHCLFQLHLKKYEDANRTLIKTLNENSDSVRYLSPLLKEYWFTIQAYIELLKLYGKIESEEEISTFRLQKFINDVPVYQKEKQGRKVAVLLVQLMFFIGRNEYGKYIDRLEALQQYRRRHLGEPNTYRANCIIRMMTKVGKLSFHPVRVEAHTRNDIKSLTSKSPAFSNSSADVEIIPYEHLWEMVLEMLEKNL